MECKLITSKNFIGTYFGHMVTISDLGAGPQSRPLPLVYYYFYKLSKLFFQKSLNPKNPRTFEAQQMMMEIQDRTPNRFHVNMTSPAFFSKTNIVFDESIAATLTRLSQQG